MAVSCAKRSGVDPWREWALRFQQASVQQENAGLFGLSFEASACLLPVSATPSLA